MWGFEEQVDFLMEEKFDDLDTDTDKQSDYKRGVRDGAELVVNEHERECLDESPDECFGLGEAAAMQVSFYDMSIIPIGVYYCFLVTIKFFFTAKIAFDYCPFSAADATGYSSDEPEYKQTCREVAYGICAGTVGDMVESNGCDISTSDLVVLQEECEGEVDSMTPSLTKSIARRGLKK